MEMNQDCNLELRLLPPSSSPPDQTPAGAFFKDNQKKQKMTIFYNGNINVSDVTELQAREIIMVASREEDRIRYRASLDQEKARRSPPAPAPAPICSNNNNNNGVSMHRSLHRFLQMRKNRIQSASPYAAH